MASVAVTQAVVGFVGTGTIAQAVVRGLCTAAGAPVCRQLLLSPRSVSRSAALAAEFPACRVAASNQQVVDNAVFVFIGLRAQDAEDELRSLRFRAGQTIGAAYCPTPLPPRTCQPCRARELGLAKVRVWASSMSPSCAPWCRPVVMRSAGMLSRSKCVQLV
jgi:hypothetical protein